MFKNIIDRLSKNNRFCSINPYFRGEALLHPQFSEFMDYIYERSLESPVCEYIVLHTNGLLLDKNNARSILQVCDQSRLIHPGNLIISIDAASKETYINIRGGDFDRLIENIKGFLSIRKERSQWGPNIVFQFIVQKRNIEEIMDFYKLITGLCDKYSGKKINTVASINNGPFEIKSDVIYYRMLETDEYSYKESENIYLNAIENLKKTIDIEVF